MKRAACPIRDTSHQKVDEKLGRALVGLLADRPIDKISVSELCKLCGISRGTFYVYYDDKYQLLESVEQRLTAGMERVASHFDSFPLLSYAREDFEIGFFVEGYEYIWENREAYRALLGPTGDPSFRWRSERAIARTLLQNHEVTSAATADIDFTVSIAAKTGIAIAEYWINKRPDLSPQRLSSMAARALVGIITSMEDGKD